MTLNWLRPEPTHGGFGLTREEVDAGRYRRNLRVQQQVLFAGGLLAAGIFGALLADAVFAFRVFDSEMSVFAAIWAGTSSVLLSVFIYVLAMLAVVRYRQAEPRRTAYEAACVEFAQIDAWRRVRCERGFWSDRLNDAEFEFEAAELLAGYLKTGQVMLTRPTADYGVDVLACSPIGRIVAQCKPAKGRRADVGQVLALAGSKAFFEADFAFMLSVEKPFTDQEQCAAIAASQRIELWDAAHIAAVAQQLRSSAQA